MLPERYDENIHADVSAEKILTMNDGSKHVQVEVEYRLNIHDVGPSVLNIYETTLRDCVARKWFKMPLRRVKKDTTHHPIRYLLLCYHI